MHVVFQGWIILGSPCNDMQFKEVFGLIEDGKIVIEELKFNYGTYTKIFGLEWFAVIVEPIQLWIPFG